MSSKSDSSEKSEPYEHKKEKLLHESNTPVELANQKLARMPQNIGPMAFAMFTLGNFFSDLHRVLVCYIFSKD